MHLIGLWNDWAIPDTEEKHLSATRSSDSIYFCLNHENKLLKRIKVYSKQFHLT